MYMDTETMILGVLSKDAFLMVNKKIARKIGFVEAGLLGELISTFEYVKSSDEFFQCKEEKNWFYLKQQTIEERLGIRRREHDTAIKKLVDHGLIIKKKLGLPAKAYYIICWEKIGELLYEKEPKPAPLSDCTKRTNKEVQNVQTRMDDLYNHTIYKKDINKKDINKKDYKDLNPNPNQMIPNTEIRSLEQEAEPIPEQQEKDVRVLKLPERVKKMIYDHDLYGYGYGQGNYNSLDPLAIEKFYNTSPYVKLTATRYDSDFINEYDFIDIVKAIIEKVDKPIENTIGILNRFTHLKLSYKSENQDYLYNVGGYDPSHDE